ncbi:penicillin-binding protein 1B [Ketobacter sp.]|uniref:penicillin-binding protein 1B n=1 Tax=Ketobacter sp. TaxID=2083498 RepID=UPI000F2CBBBF|nr:penicillin-binding protein 1B [Ketobacter sp.]RLU01183.1 MAG: penicillin-binding protein 1B [Ketobacter sp.]
MPAKRSTPRSGGSPKSSAKRKPRKSPARPAATKKRSRSTAPPRRRWGALVWKLGLVFGLLGLLGVIYLDAVITHHFEGKRWSIPAKVYARPLELYDGMPLTEAQLAFELSLLNYRHVFDRPVSGTFSTAAGGYEIVSRGFDFWEGAEPSQRVRFRLRGGRVTDLDSGSQSAAIVRLEPPLIGGIYPAHNEDRVLVKLDQVPQQLLQALLAVEDRDFFEHFGLSFKGIARAFYTNITAGEVRQGGSTLTQQLVKNFYLSSERSLTRKGIEAVMAVLLDFHYAKTEILEAYLNEVYLGQAGKRAIHGVGLGSLYYFGVPLRELTTEQIALLVGVIKGPSWYDPRRNPERALERRNQVLQIMLQQGVLDQRAYDQVINKPLGVIKKPLYEDARYPAFLELMKRQLRKDYRDEDLRSEGLRIFTTLDPWAQESLEQAAQQQIRNLQSGYGKSLQELEVAGLFTSSNTGEVVAVVGGKAVRYEGFNRALDAYRPIGSLAKPAVYLAALEGGAHLGTLLQDEPLQHVLPNGSVWSPKNFEKESHGEVPMVVALAQSYNQATARLALSVGIDKVVDVMARLGLQDKPLPRVPALSLGAVSLSPYEVTRMYQTIATEGFATPLRTIRSVLTAEGEPLQRYEFEVEQRFNAADIYMLTYAMQETVRSGTGKSTQKWLSPDLQLAGKTGTSDEQRDSWFAGFSGNYLGVVWMGIDSNQPTPLTGASGALPVWANTMASLPQVPLQAAQPENVEWVWIDPTRQARTSAHCDNALYLPLRSDTVPEDKVSCNAGGRVLNWFKRLIR